MNRHRVPIRVAAVGVLAAMVLTGAPPLAHLAEAGASCRVRNVTQDTRDRSLRRMVTAAHPGDRLRVRGTCTGGVTITKDLVIRGVGPDATISGRLRYRVLSIVSRGTDEPHVRLREIRIVQGGSSRRNGAGINVRDASVTLIDAIVADNATEMSGGGIAVRGGTLTLRRTVVRDNIAFESGGGVYGHRSTVTLIDSVVRHNAVAAFGGGISNSGTMTVIDSEVRDNIAHGGGGIFSSGRLSIRGSSVRRNIADRGGGIAMGAASISTSGGDVELLSTTVSSNDARYGGGIFAYASAVRLGDTRITANRGWKDGGGVYSEDPDTTLVVIGPSAITGNDPNDCAGTVAC